MFDAITIVPPGLGHHARRRFAHPEDPSELEGQVTEWLEATDWQRRVKWGDDSSFELDPVWLVLWVGELDPGVGCISDYPESATLYHELRIDLDYGDAHCTVDIECATSGPWLVIRADSLTID